MGLFDQTNDPEDGVTLSSPFEAPQTPMPPQMAPPQQLPQLPVPPQAPAAPGNTQRIISMALAGLAAGLGPRHGGAGVANGLAVGQHYNDEQRQQQFQNEQVLYQNQIREQAVQAEQQRRDQVEADRRQQALEQALGTIRNEVKTITDKDMYDQRVESYANILRASGYRIDANWLRQNVRFIAPTARQRARQALDDLHSDPLFKEQVKADPSWASRGTMNIDLNGDGIAEVHPIAEVYEAAERSLLLDDKGNPVGIATSTDGPMANIALKAGLAQFKAENNRDPNPKEMQGLVEKARETPKDPLTEELKQQRLDAAKNKAAHPEMDDKVKRRIDMKTKAFDSLPVVKRVQTMAEGASFANSLDKNTKNPADDQALIYAFAKVMDPESVVREGEYATVQKYAQSWAQSFGFNAARMFSNTPFLTPEARANMKATMMAKFGASRKQYDNVRRSYTDLINQITGKDDGDTWLTDYGGSFPEDAAASARRKLDQK
jgi:hypothetical protein